MMSRRQIDTSRERRLWLTQVAIPVLMLLVTAYQIPDARDVMNRTYYNIKYKVINFIDRIKRR